MTATTEPPGQQDHVAYELRLEQKAYYSCYLFRKQKYLGAPDTHLAVDAQGITFDVYSLDAHL